MEQDSAHDAPGNSAAGMPAELRAALDAVFRAEPVTALLAIELLDWSAGTAAVAMTPGPSAANIVGTVHGGLLCALADTAFSVACNSYGRVCVALDVAVHHAAAALVGERLVAVAAEVSRSERVASYRIEIRGMDEALRAWCLATAYRTSAWHLGADRWPASWRERH